MIIKTKINIDDFLLMMNWVYTYYTLEQKNFNYMPLFEQAQTYKLSDTPLDTKIHKIDDFMVDVYRVYDHLTQMEEKIELMYDSMYPLLKSMMGDLSNQYFSFPSKKMLLNEIGRFAEVFADMMENYRYENTEIRGIQKNFLQDMLKDASEKEEYERAAQIRDMLKGL